MKPRGWACASASLACSSADTREVDRLHPVPEPYLGAFPRADNPSRESESDMNNRRAAMGFRRCILLTAPVVACIAAPAQAQWVATPYIDTNVAGDVQTGRGGIGASVAYYFRGRLGFELDVERHGHFFRDEDVAGLVPEGVDLDTDATLFMGNVVAPFRVQGSAGIWCPYGTAGLGVIRAVFDGFAGNFNGGAGQGDYHTHQNDLAFNAGGGVMHALTDLVGLRVDVRYFRALVDKDAGKGGYLKDYDFWRVSVGVTFGFPQ